MNNLFEKINVVLTLRLTALFLFGLYVIQAVINASRGAAIDDMILIFIVTIANGIFQPVIMLGVAEVINQQRKKI